MAGSSKDAPSTPMLKIVYFDEETASDYLDISAGGKAASTSENVRDRTTKLHGEVETKLAAKFSWIPFLGASAEAGTGAEVARAGQSILRKTLSNTILTDYLARVKYDPRIARLKGLHVTAPKKIGPAARLGDRFCMRHGQPGAVMIASFSMGASCRVGLRVCGGGRCVRSRGPNFAAAGAQALQTARKSLAVCMPPDQDRLH